MQLLINKFFHKEMFTYIIFGVFTTIVNFLVYESCILWGIGYQISTIIAWACAVAFAFFTNKLFVFHSKSFKWNILLKELITFLFARLASGLIDLLFMIFAVELLKMNDSLAKLLSNVFVVVINYFFSKLIIFKTK